MSVLQALNELMEIKQKEYKNREQVKEIMESFEDWSCEVTDKYRINIQEMCKLKKEIDDLGRLIFVESDLEHLISRESD